MKKLFCLFLVALCLVALAGCGSTTVESNAPEALKLVPTLTVYCGENSVEALQGAQQWWYGNGDGTQTTFVTDSLPILACKEYMTPLAIVPVTYSAHLPMARLEFSVVPDRVSARSWSVDSFYGPGEPVDDGYYDTLIYTVEPEPDIDEAVVYYMEMPYEARVYEITATWDSYEHFGGEVCYGFYTEAMTLRDAEDLCGYPTVEGMTE